mgnify:CR=1 FL=1
MNVAYSDSELTNYLGQAASVNSDHPVVISKFILEAKVNNLSFLSHFSLSPSLSPSLLSISLQ